MTRYLDLDAFRRTPLSREPFDFLIMRGFLKTDARTALDADYPPIESAGSHPVNDLKYGPAFAALLDELRGPELQSAMSEKFGIPLAGRPTIITARGRARLKDGRIHTDTPSKIITVLVYMNQDHWPSEGGRLRLLRKPDDLNDVVAEVPPDWGNLVAFRRSDNSYHGHKPFDGPRRVLQLNWVTEQSVVDRELQRHGMTARIKKLFPWAGGY